MELAKPDKVSVGTHVIYTIFLTPNPYDDWILHLRTIAQSNNL